uniref:Uncharacterized protein LOC111105632 n=1 Tax=Crassostrea virginica TaxID=6565 RepID=A0A8B8AZG9_CRAVI|nr:uncharacterized protein LOC111105632 [Crassostrea virginica]
MISLYLKLDTHSVCIISTIGFNKGTRPYFRTTVNMCKKDEYYVLDTGECLPCSECPKGDSVIFKCHYFGDTVCEKDVFKGLIMDFPTPNPSLVTRGPGTVAVEVPGTVAVEVLPEDWTTSPTLLTVITAVCFTTLMITIVIALYCIRRKMCHPKHEKEILYLSRPYPRYQHPRVDEDERYQPLPSRERLKKTNYFGNSHIYVNMLHESLDSDYCTIDDYVNIDEHLVS